MWYVGAGIPGSGPAIVNVKRPPCTGPLIVWFRPSAPSHVASAFVQPEGTRTEIGVSGPSGSWIVTSLGMRVSTR